MDPASAQSAIVAVASAGGLLASQVAGGIAGEAGRDAWAQVKRLLHVDGRELVEDTDVEVMIRDCLQQNPDLVEPVAELLSAAGVTASHSLVGSVTAEKVVIAERIEGDIHM